MHSRALTIVALVAVVFTLLGGVAWQTKITAVSSALPPVEGSDHGNPGMSRGLESSSIPGTKVLIADGGRLRVVTNASTVPAEARDIAKLDEFGFIVLPETTQRVFVEVGTNDEPELTSMLRSTRDAVLVAFEPQPAVFDAMVTKFPTKERLIAVPAAVASHPSFLTLHVSEHRGCTSLLPMNKRASNFARKHKAHAVKKGVRIQLRTIEFCASQSHEIEIPAFPLSAIIARLPPKLPIELLVTDAQGFDTSVLATVEPAHRDRIHFIVAECQDLEPGHSLFLVTGAPSCSEQQRCIENAFPHRLDFCWDNAPKVRELNCLYRHPTHAPASRPVPPKLKMVGGAKGLAYTGPTTYVCP